MNRSHDFIAAIAGLILVLFGVPNTAEARTNVVLDASSRVFLIGNGLRPADPYPCDLEFAKQLAGKRAWPFSNLDLLYYPHRVIGLDDEYAQNLKFIADNVLPYSPGLVFSGATVQHGDVTFRPEDGPANLGLAQPFNRHSIARQVALLNADGLIPARHLSLSGMILEQLPAGASNRDWYIGIKPKAVGEIASAHTMVHPNYANPSVREYLADTFSVLTQEAGFHYYWMDNWSENTEFYPKVYQAVRSGAERNGGWAILRSGAGPSQVGLTDILAPSPDIQDAWRYVSDIFTRRVIGPYVRYCPNAFKLGFDDFYINEPFTRDQARFLASLYALPGMEITITEGEFFKTPMERMGMLQKILPLPVTGPLQPVAPEGAHIWIQSIRRTFEAWQVAACFNESPFEPRSLLLKLNDLDAKPGPVLAWDFWDERFLGVFQDQVNVKLGSASCLVMALRPLEKHPQFLSTDRHILQGAEEIADLNWDESSGCLSGVFARGVAGRSFSVFIHVPANWHFSGSTGGIQKVKQMSPEILKLELAAEAGQLSWGLCFKQGDPTLASLPRVSSVTNTAGELVVQQTRLDEAWVRTAEGWLARAIIPPGWQRGHVRVHFTLNGDVSVRVNGKDCPLIQDPARRFTAWYTTEGESTFEMPSSAILWGESNQIEVIPKSVNWKPAPASVGLQLDLSGNL